MITDRISKINAQIPEHVQLVAVSKTHTQEKILEAYNAGIKVFGENKVQELVQKHTDLPKDIQWHFIGHLQTNKVKYIAPFVSLIHAVDSLKLFKTIQKEAKKNNRIIPCLLQFHIAEEDTKFGLSLEEAQEIIEYGIQENCNNVAVYGVMGMATYTSNQEQVRSEFSCLRNMYNQLKEKYYKNSPDFSHISMGMSDDYKLAIEEGSTMVRIGSEIFGSRY